MRARAGFTLLEMLVVVFIIGLVAAGAILSLGATGRDRQLEQERDRLTALIAYVRDRGAMMTTEYGIRCGQHGYRFVYYDNRTLSWQPETLDDTLRERKLPRGLDLQLVIEGRPVVLDDHALEYNAAAASAAAQIAGMAPASASTQSGAGSGTGTGTDSGLGAPPLDAPAVDDNTPQILLLSDGDANSFALTIERPSAHHSVTLKSAADGTISAGEIEQATS
jgi:type II secretion system protein H